MQKQGDFFNEFCCGCGHPRNAQNIQNQMYIKQEMQSCVCFLQAERACVGHNHTRQSAGSFYPRRETVFGPSLHRSMRRTKRTGFVAPAISRSHSCLFLTMWHFKSTSRWVKISMWDELWHLTEVNGSTMLRVPGIVDVRGLSYAFRSTGIISIYARRRVLIAGVAAGSALDGCDWVSLAEQLATFRKIVAAFSLTTQRHVFTSLSCVCGSDALVLQRTKYMRSENTTTLLARNCHVPPCAANRATVTGNWLSFRYDIIIIIIIIIIHVITCMHGIYNYIPEANHVSRVYSVAAVLYVQSVLHVMLLSVLNMLCAFTLALSSSSSSYNYYY